MQRAQYDPLEDIFVAQITDAALGGDGNWYYTGVEQSIDASSGQYANADSPRTFSPDGPFLWEQNNRQVLTANQAGGSPTPLFVRCRLRCVYQGFPLYEFTEPTWSSFGRALEDLPAMCGDMPGEGVVEIYQYQEETNEFLDANLSLTALNFLHEMVPAGDWVHMVMEPYTGRYTVVGHHPDACSSSSSSSSESSESSGSSSSGQGVCVVTDVSCDDGLDVTSGLLTGHITINGKQYAVTFDIDTSKCGGESSSGGS